MQRESTHTINISISTNCLLSNFTKNVILRASQALLVPPPYSLAISLPRRKPGVTFGQAGACALCLGIFLSIYFPSTFSHKHHSFVQLPRAEKKNPLKRSPGLENLLPFHPTSQAFSQHPPEIEKKKLLFILRFFFPVILILSNAGVHPGVVPGIFCKAARNFLSVVKKKVKLNNPATIWNISLLPVSFIVALSIINSFLSFLELNSPNIVSYICKHLLCK